MLAVTVALAAEEDLLQVAHLVGKADPQPKAAALGLLGTVTQVVVVIHFMVLMALAVAVEQALLVLLATLLQVLAETVTAEMGLLILLVGLP
jgi:hypothetical protein